MIQDKELGNITFELSLKAKRMRAMILPDGIRVVLPKGFSEKDGIKFVESVRGKIRQRQAKIQHKSIVITEEKPLKTLTFAVEVYKTERKDIFSSLKSGVLTIQYPDFLVCEEQKTQEYFWKSINYFLRKEAKRLLPYRTYELAQQFGFRYADVKIQSSKTRWGSCNRKKNINLSFYLLLLPQYLIDYVILHELCHTREMNHSDKFWKEMDSVTNSKSKVLRRELKNYSMPR
ncbi:conserved hypothetical protein [uncultured Paludibacter sp.]|nr:conserved hypothetical protein [uncultured Paludibacter sp.]